VPDLRTQLRSPAGQAAVLFAAAGIVALLAAVAPAQRVDRVLVGLSDLLLAAIVQALPWQRWHRSQTLWLVVPACAAIGLATAVALLPLPAYGVFFVLVFAWVGAAHQPSTSLFVLPAIAAGYVVPLAVLDDITVDVRGLVATIGVGVAVAELVARTVRASRRAQAQAERAAQSFRTVSGASSGLRALDPRQVLDAVTDAVMDLGYDGADISLVDTHAGIFRPAHTRGIASGFDGRSFALGTGATATVVAEGEVMVTHECTAAKEPTSGVEVGTVIAVPVRLDGRVYAVLHAASRDRAVVAEEQIEALRMLATTAGIALETAGHIRAELNAAQAYADEAVTDALTGVPNRRHADRLLQGLQPGDVVALTDLDHFKEVNDRDGHQRGDEVLIAFAHHVEDTLRAGDTVCRFGGEEFLVLLPSTTMEDAVGCMERILRSWRDTHPVTTFSVGLAQHRPERERFATLGAADAALYEAKHAGRDRCCVEEQRD
jgi:diguanylate cyclase (GGDEF)-like protein